MIGQAWEENPDAQMTVAWWTNSNFPELEVRKTAGFVPPELWERVTSPWN